MEDELDCSMVDGMGLSSHVLAKWLLERPNVEFEVRPYTGCQPYWLDKLRYIEGKKESFVELIVID